jgi:hypothetical protein
MALVPFCPLAILGSQSFQAELVQPSFPPAGELGL